MLRAPLKAGERPRATPVMIPTHTSRAPAAAVERSFKSWFTRANLSSERAAQEGITRANGQVANSPYSAECVDGRFSEVGADCSYTKRTDTLPSTSNSASTLSATPTG